MVRIPAEYQEVEYIESTGAQHIDTGIFPQLNDAVEITFYSDATHDSLRPFGAYNPGVAVDGYRGMRIWTDSVYELGAVIGGGKNDTIICTSDGTWTLNGETVATEFPIQTNDRITITIFRARYTNDNLYGKAKIRLYKFVYTRANEVIQNLIPCYYKSSGEIGMYDIVSKTFFTNQGTGTFLKGNDVTYDPISLLETRRKILLNTPHIETASGSIATFNTDLAANLKECKIHFLPVQEGTGDPSPDNVRPITGWDGVTVYHSGSDRTTPLEIPISFGRTIYGGYVDLVNGEVVEEWAKTAFGDDWKFTNSANRIFGKSMPTRKITTTGSDSELICNKYPTDNTRPISQVASMPDKVITARSTYNTVMIKDSTYETVDLFESGNSDGEFAYKLATPNTYTITPETIKALKGVNNIWSNANGDVEVKYWKH